MKKIVTIAVVSLSMNCFGQTIITEAPSVSASAVTVPKNGFQIEATFTHQMQKSGFGANHYLGLPSTLMRYGISDRLELRGGFMPKYFTYSNDIMSSSDFNIEGLSLGAKFGFVKDKTAPTQFAAIAAISFPSIVGLDDQAAFDDTRGINITFSMSHAFTAQHSIGSNLGWYYMNGLSSTDNTGVISNGLKLAAYYSFAYNERLSFFGEVFTQAGQSISHYSGQTEGTMEGNYGIDAGALFLLKENIQIDYAIGYQFDHLFIQSLGIDILF